MHTMISAFSDRASAEQARDRLVASGFGRQDVHIEHRDLYRDRGTAPGNWEGQEREIAVDRGVLESLGHFFTSLFGQESPTGEVVGTYRGHAERGHYVLVLDAHNETEAHRAHQVVNELGAVDASVVRRPEQRPVRDIVAERQALGDVSEPAMGMRDSAAIEREKNERAFAFGGEQRGVLPERDKEQDKDKPNR